MWPPVRQHVYSRTQPPVLTAPFQSGSAKGAKPALPCKERLQQSRGVRVLRGAPFPLTDPIDTAKTVIQADVTGAKYRGMLQTLPELYRTNGIARLYSGGLARTIRTCGAFFIVRGKRPLANIHQHVSAEIGAGSLACCKSVAGFHHQGEVHTVQGGRKQVLGQVSNSVKNLVWLWSEVHGCPACYTALSMPRPGRSSIFDVLEAKERVAY